MPPTSPQPLDYAPPPPLRQRAVTRRILLAVVALFIGVSLGFKIPELWQRLLIHHLQQKCLAYVNSPQSTVAEFQNGKQIKASTPTEWMRFYALLSPPGFLSGGTIFLHQRTSPSGNNRLVAVDVSSVASALVNTRAFQCGTLLSLPKMLKSDVMILDVHNWNKDAKVFAGQPDPNDASHFTFAVVSDGQTDQFDGWLKDDDRVVIETRAAVTPPAPASAGRSR